MKFSDLFERIVHESAWGHFCVDYTMLEQHIFFMANEKDFISSLSSLVLEVMWFWESLSKEVHKVNAYISQRRGCINWVREVSSLVIVPELLERRSEESKDIVALDAFAEFNKIIVHKIIKKFDQQVDLQMLVEIPSMFRDLSEKRLQCVVETAFPSHSASASGLCCALTRHARYSTEGALQSDLVSVHQIGLGRHTQEYSLERISHVHFPNGLVDGSRIVIKVGHWNSSRTMLQEVKLQELAAAAGLAPRIWFHSTDCELDLAHSTSSSDSNQRNGTFLRGLIAMEKVNGPSLMRWTMWLSEIYLLNEEKVTDKGMQCKLTLNEEDEWVVHPVVAQLPIVETWMQECRRLQNALFDLGIDHGLACEDDYVFDVLPAESEYASSFSKPVIADQMSQDELQKHKFLAVIGRGLSDGVRLLRVGFGHAINMRPCHNLRRKRHECLHEFDLLAISGTRSSRLSARPERVSSVNP